MKSFNTSTNIQASPETIWNLLVDGANWSRWNPTIAKIEGKIALGETVRVYTKINPEQAFSVKVSKFVPHKQMVWTSSMPLGLFQGERTYCLSKQPDGSVMFSMQEVYSGLLAPLIIRSIPDLQASFNEFATSLKQRAEENVF